MSGLTRVSSLPNKTNIQSPDGGLLLTFHTMESYTKGFSSVVLLCIIPVMTMSYTCMFLVKHVWNTNEQNVTHNSKMQLCVQVTLYLADTSDTHYYMTMSTFADKSQTQLSQPSSLRLSLRLQPYFNCQMLELTQQHWTCETCSLWQYRPDYRKVKCYMISVNFSRWRKKSLPLWSCLAVPKRSWSFLAPSLRAKKQG